jgi:LL-diaminopimelate aminotransferase
MARRFPLADRLTQLPPYLFAEIDRMKQEVRARGVDLISLGIGDPDLATPPHIIAALEAGARDPANHQYPSYEGLLSFRQAVADWYAKRFGVALDPATEVLSLIGSKEGVGHLPLAFVNPGDVVLVPDPGYPVYHAGTVFCGGISHCMPLRKANGFLPDFDAIPAEVRQRARVCWINYPNNPTAAVAPREFFARAVEFAHRHDLVLCHDAAYSEIAFDGYEPPSLLSVPGAREVAVELHSLSKTYNMTGWRVAFAVGNAEILAGLGQVKTNLDSGVFQAIQQAGIAALTGPQECVARMRAIYQERRDVLVDGLREMGWRLEVPKASFYVWVETPGGLTSAEVAKRLLSEAGVVVTPGNGFGPSGEGYVRAALTVEVGRIREAVGRIRQLNLTG